MLRKYGKDVVDDLESREFTSKKWTREELEAIRTDYRDRIRRIERGEQPPEVSNHSRVEVRDVFADLGAAG